MCYLKSKMEIFSTIYFLIIGSIYTCSIVVDDEAGDITADVCHQRR